MAYESQGAEIIEAVAPVSEVTPQQTLRLVGKLAMPDKAKEVYYLARGSEQLVIPYYAGPLDTLLEVSRQ